MPPSKEGMLGFLINTKVIDKEIIKHQHEKDKEIRMKKREPRPIKSNTEIFPHRDVGA